MTPISPLESGVEHLGMYQRGKPFFAHASSLRSSLERPVSIVSEAYTDIEDDSSEFEEYSLGSSSDNRRSQTTISTFEEVRTPGGTPSEEIQPHFADQWYLPKAVEGPKGPHLFRASHLTNDFDFALQMSPLFPKDQASLMQAAFREATPDTIVPRKEYNSIANAVAHLDTAEVRAWTSREVSTWMYQNGFESDIIDRFRSHDITGAILLDLQFEDLKELEIRSFGKRHQLWNQIDSLRTGDGLVSPVAPAPVPTPFEDISRPCTGARNRSKSKNRERRNRDKSRGPKIGEGEDCITPGGARRRGRQPRNGDILTPAESISIVAIEQLLPKPHKCNKGENCPKWRKQQRQLARLQDEHGFPISPEKGGRIFIAGDPGNAQTAARAVDHVYRPTSDAVPSLVASSDLLGPGQLPEILLEEDMLKSLDRRDPQDNVRQFLALQGLEHPFATATPIEAPPTPPMDMFSASRPSYIPMYPEVSGFSTSNSSAPSTHTSVSFEHSDLPSAPLHPPEFTPAPHHNLKSLPRLAIPRSMSAGPSIAPQSITPTPHTGHTVIDTAFSPCRTASPGGVYRFGTPFSEMDAPVTAIPVGPVSRETTQSVPPNMQYRDPMQRSGSTRDWRRPSLPLPALNEDQVFDPAAPAVRHQFDDAETLHETRFSGASSADSTPVKTAKPMVGSGSPGKASGFAYDGVAHHGWMKKRRTKLLRHEWQDHHFRLNGTLLAMHPNELPSSSALQTIDVDDYAVACSSLVSNKLSAKFKALKISHGHKDKVGNPTPAFEFQLVPTAPGKGEVKRILPNGKLHHFAVKSKDERIDWMRELMLAKAIKAKGDGYEVNVNGADV